MTFLAILFAASPGLEAIACAADGCELAAAGEALITADANAGQPASDNCADGQCHCVVGHCVHAGVLSVALETAHIWRVSEQAFGKTPEFLISADAQGLERPPRI